MTIRLKVAQFKIPSKLQPVVGVVAEQLRLFGSYLQFLLGLIVGAAILYGLAAMAFALLIAPHVSSSMTMSSQPPTSSEEVAQSSAALVSAMLGDPSARIEFRVGLNLIVYMNQRVLEDVPFPDRTAFVEKAGKEWCSSVDRLSSHDLPSLTVSNIRTGEKMATFGCLSERVWIASR